MGVKFPASGVSTEAAGRVGAQVHACPVVYFQTCAGKPVGWEHLCSVTATRLRTIKGK
jgi:hypothetical protein